MRQKALARSSSSRKKGRKEEAILSGAGLLHEQLLDMGRSGPGGRRRMCRDRTKRKGTTVIMAGFALAELTREIPQGRREEFFFFFILLFLNFAFVEVL